MLEMQGVMFLFLVSGFIMREKEILPENGKMILTNLLVDFILPCSIVHSFQVEFSDEAFSNCLLVFIIAIGIQILALVVSKTAYRQFPKKRKSILEYGTICSNAGMMGSAIAEKVFGKMGMMYASIYLVPQRIAMWTIGLASFEQAVTRRDMVKKVLLHPCIIAVGMVLAEVQHLRDMLEWQVLFYAIIRLILFPAVVFLGCIVISADSAVTGVSVLLSAMPAGSTVAVLASKYDCDTDFSTKCVVVTTLFSLVTIPAWCGILALV